MRYMLLINSEEAREANMTEQDGAKVMAAYGKFATDLQEAGAYVGADRLQPTTMATTVRVRNGQTLTTDGPFAETKEQLGGYYIINAKDLDDALQWASRVPSATEVSSMTSQRW